MPDPVDPPAPVDPPVDPPDPADPPVVDPPVEDPEVAKWKALSRKHEAAAKKAAKEAEELRNAQLSDTDKAIEEAKKAGRAEAATDYGSRIVAARIEAALTGVVPDPAGVVEDLDLSKYLTDTGEVDAEKVAALKTKYQDWAKPTRHGSGDGGPLGGPPPTPDLDAQIAAAKAAGNMSLAISLEMSKLTPTQ